jgi:hypothetical protein
MMVVTEDGEVALVDWSLAKMDEKDKVSGMVVTGVKKGGCALSCLPVAVAWVMC